MEIRVICVGDELLSGDTLNTNLQYLGEKLSEHGLRLAGEACVPDNVQRLNEAFASCSGCDAVLLVGGLGPTKDDLTRPAAAAFLGKKLFPDMEIKEKIRNYLGDRAKKMREEVLEIQAMVPEGACIFLNENGTAPGLMIEHGCTRWFLMPGPPREMKPMFEKQVLPLILEHCKPEWVEMTLRIAGVGESIAENIVLQTLGDEASKLGIAYCIKDDHVVVKLSCPVNEGGNADLQSAVERLKAAFGRHVIPETCSSAAAYLGMLLEERGMTVSTAESCTGGGIAAAFTDIPGSSRWFTGSFVTYSNQWKNRQLGVPAETLEKYGAVSGQTVSRMLDGLLERGGAELGIAVSGIAGPGGGTPEKPVGTVYIGIAGKNWQEVRRVHFNGMRDTVRMRTAATAVNMLIEKLLSKR